MEWREDACDILLKSAEKRISKIQISLNDFVLLIIAAAISLVNTIRHGKTRLKM